jgi:hypothetical protein
VDLDQQPWPIIKAEHALHDRRSSCRAENISRTFAGGRGEPDREVVDVPEDPAKLKAPGPAIFLIEFTG